MTASRGLGPWFWATLAAFAAILCSGFLYYREHGPGVISYAVLNVVFVAILAGLVWLAVALVRFFRKP